MGAGETFGEKQNEFCTKSYRKRNYICLNKNAQFNTGIPSKQDQVFNNYSALRTT